MITARAICDSINPYGSRLITMLTRYPKFIHGEHLRHRSFSFSVSSSRAIPVSKNLEEVRSDELRASPVWWGKEQKGMSAGGELDVSSLALAQVTWRRAAFAAIEQAEQLQCLGTHKSIVNRILEPFLHVNVLVSGTTNGWMNFFGLRLDSAAQPEIRVLAEECWKVWNESEPRALNPGEWHLPFIDDETSDSIRAIVNYDSGDSPEEQLQTAIEISVARCARLSYLSFETNKRSTIAEDLALYSRLVGSSPIHASPAEHQATPDERFKLPTIKVIEGKYEVVGYELGKWIHEAQKGNFDPSWRQYRKMLPNEAIAPLPSKYINPS